MLRNERFVDVSEVCEESTIVAEESNDEAVFLF